ncbi:MAG: hypothetical protein EOR99_35050 [Mesorhizobium sp.]|nr:MAG: hypothetical protein EOR99_35050 [Mesorhizobium sp.]
MNQASANVLIFAAPGLGVSAYRQLVEMQIKMDAYYHIARSVGVDDAEARRILEAEMEKSKASGSYKADDAFQTAQRSLLTLFWDRKS